MDSSHNSYIGTLVEQPDGRLIVSGYLNTSNGGYISKTFRLHANGKLDTTFHSGTGFNNPIDQIILQPDGKIIVTCTGRNSAYNNFPFTYIIRLKSNGEVDSTFHNNRLPFAQSLRSLLLQQDGMLLVGGAYEYGGTLYKQNNIQRIYTNSITVSAQPQISKLTLLPTPNPASQTFTLQNLTQPKPLTLRDATGRTVLHTTARPQEAISIRSLPKGLYLWQTHQAQGRLVVE